MTPEEYIAMVEEENKKLKEKVETLELWLDNKEKLNEEYRKQIDKKKLSTIAEETIQDLQKEIKELKNMINTAIGIAYDKDDYDGIEYLVHERDRSEYFISKQIKDGKA